jgi:hypothetical protein
LPYWLFGFGLKFKCGDDPHPHCLVFTCDVGLT